MREKPSKCYERTRKEIIMKKRLLAGFITVCMLMTLASGCKKKGNGAEDTAKNGSTKESTSSETQSGGNTDSSKQSGYQTTYGSKQFDNVKITVELFDRSNAPEGSTITDNRWVDYVNQEMNKVGITVDFVTVPRWDEVTKMQAMMASGTAPDLTVTYTYSYAEDYYNKGGVWDLSEFIDGEDQAQNLKAYLGEDVLNIGRNADKNLYGVVAKRATTAQDNLFIRKDWLDALGLAVPTTPDELYDVLYKMVYNNPDNMQNVTGAVIWNAWNLRMAFSQLCHDATEMMICDGEDAIADYYDPGMKDYYKFMNKLYNAGLLDQEYYTLSEDNFKSKVATGTLGFFEYSVNGNVDVLRGSLLKTLQENVPTADIVSIPNLKNVNDGNAYCSAYAAGGLIAFCPKTADAEKVEACMTYLDWQASQDGGFVLYHGFEGEHYDLVDGVPVVKDAAYNSTDKDWIRTDIFLVGNQGYFETVDDFNVCTSKEAPGYEEYVINNYNNAVSGTMINETTYTSPSTPDIIADITLTEDEYTVSCITCAEADFEKTFEDYMSQLKADGVQTIIDERTEHFR